MVLIPPPTYLQGLPNPIRTDLKHIVVQQLDGQHAANNVPLLKALLKWGLSPIYAPVGGAVGLCTENGIETWATQFPTYPQPVPVGSEEKLILSKCSFGGPQNAFNEGLEAALIPGWEDTHRPIVNFCPYGQKVAYPTILPCPHSVGIFGMSGSEWPIMFMWAVACAAMPEAIYNGHKADGTLTTVLNDLVKSEFALLNGWFQWLNKPVKLPAVPIDLTPFAVDVALLANNLV